MVEGPKCCQFDVLHLVEHHQLLGLDERPQEITLQDLVLMQQGALPDLFLQDLLCEIPILAQLAGDVVEVCEREGRELVVNLFLEFIAGLAPELKGE